MAQKDVINHRPLFRIEGGIVYKAGGLHVVDSLSSQAMVCHYGSRRHKSMSMIDIMPLHAPKKSG